MEEDTRKFVSLSSTYYIYLVIPVLFCSRRQAEEKEGRGEEEGGEDQTFRETMSSHLRKNLQLLLPNSFTIKDRHLALTSASTAQPAPPQNSWSGVHSCFDDQLRRYVNATADCFQFAINCSPIRPARVLAAGGGCPRDRINIYLWGLADGDVSSGESDR